MFAPPFPPAPPSGGKPHASHVFFELFSIVPPIAYSLPTNPKHLAPVPLDEGHTMVAAGILSHSSNGGHCTLLRLESGRGRL